MLVFIRKNINTLKVNSFNKYNEAVQLYISHLEQQ